MPTRVYSPDGSSRTELKPFSFKGREYLKKPYNTDASRILLMCGRQVEKSTLLGNTCLAHAALRRFFRALYVSPTQQQTETFSRDRLEAPIDCSPELTQFITGKGAKTKNNVLYKKFLTGSDITLRYAFLSAARIRGVSADMLMIDELQDILTDIIPVIEEALSHSEYKIFRYSGTPKSLDNTIAYYWERFSTQNEWLIPCDTCGSKHFGSRHWNRAGMKNIGSEGLVCSKCLALINPQHEDAQWVSFNPKPDVPQPFEGYRITQLITPWVSWDDILNKLKIYKPQKFYNEVLGYGFDMGERPLTSADIKKCCNEAITLTNQKHVSKTTMHFAGIDWGTGENAYTVIVVGGYYGGKFRIVYARRFEGEETDPEVTMRMVCQIIRRFRCVLVGTDYGGGFDRNAKLVRTFGVTKIIQYQYANPGEKMIFQKKLGRYMLRRTEILYDLLEAIRRGTEFEFPRWSEWQLPFAKDMVSIFSEYNESRKQQVLNKVPGATDDTLHSILYCFLASMARFPRPDILKPGA